MINVIQCKNKCYKARDTHGVRTLFGLHPAFLKTLLHPPPPAPITSIKTTKRRSSLLLYQR